MFGFIAMLHYSILFLPLLLSILQIKVHGFGHFAHESFVELVAWSSLTNASICSITAIVFVFFLRANVCVFVLGIISIGAAKIGKIFWKNKLWEQLIVNN